MVAAPQSTQSENDETIESLVLPAPTTSHLILVAGSRGYSIRGIAHVRNIASPPVIHEITPGSIVDYYGTPAIKSTKGKHDPGLPIKHWWITAPLAEAVVVAEQLSTHRDRLFPPLLRQDAVAPRSDQMLDAFTAHVNTTSDRTGLERIPPGHMRPHMFRRTMAMLTDQFPGSEIALGIQLKHIAARALANRSTQGYANPNNSWVAHLESAIDAARFRRIEDLYQAHKSGEPIGYGPGAAQMAHTFNDVHHTAQARGGDATVERALLRKARISIRFGALNHCVMDENNPVGAVCLDKPSCPKGTRVRYTIGVGPTDAPTASSARNTYRSGPPSGAPCSRSSTHQDCQSAAKKRYNASWA